MLPIPSEIFASISFLFVFLAPIIAARGISRQSKFIGFTTWLNILVAILVAFFFYEVILIATYYVRFPNNDILATFIADIIDDIAHVLIALSFVVSLAINHNRLGTIPKHFKILLFTGLLLVILSLSYAVDDTFFYLSSFSDSVNTLAGIIFGFIYFLFSLPILLIAIVFVKDYKEMLAQQVM